MTSGNSQNTSQSDNRLTQQDINDFFKNASQQQWEQITSLGAGGRAAGGGTAGGRASGGATESAGVTGGTQAGAGQTRVGTGRGGDGT